MWKGRISSDTNACEKTWSQTHFLFGSLVALCNPGSHNDKHAFFVTGKNARFYTLFQNRDMQREGGQADLNPDCIPTRKKCLFVKEELNSEGPKFSFYSPIQTDRRPSPLFVCICAAQWRATTRCCQCRLLFPEIANQRTTPTGNSHSSWLQLQMDLGTFPWSKRAKLHQNELDLAQIEVKRVVKEI